MTLLQVLIAVLALAVIVGFTVHASLRQRRERAEGLASAAKARASKESLDTMRARYAIELHAWFGKPSSTVTDVELMQWALLRERSLSLPPVTRSIPTPAPSQG